eukprot:CAMPEP_0172417702 /NCGR_PEP_ID=MMETSP1064-20121228/4223_1 /TAXON_ID=202472 /ORGANISM="Aulacoseira subarctica , Strain CCAP 1002/5" /LENGTH=156 /DNA_ID=CAMNT_0013156193 /DNA_START=92 /DNA_END=559 /DNA_ORIENTATION=-
MKKFAIISAFLLALHSLECNAFSSSFTRVTAKTGSVSSGVLTMEYIPSGMSKEQWKKIKEAEKKKLEGKNLGKEGITSFSSRTLSEWQKAGGKNLFPVNPKEVKDLREIPYMQRPGGKPDDSDLKPKSSGIKLPMFAKKPEAKKEPEKPQEKKTNW